MLSSILLPLAVKHEKKFWQSRLAKSESWSIRAWHSGVWGLRHAWWHFLEPGIHIQIVVQLCQRKHHLITHHHFHKSKHKSRGKNRKSISNLWHMYQNEHEPRSKLLLQTNYALYQLHPFFFLCRGEAELLNKEKQSSSKRNKEPNITATLWSVKCHILTKGSKVWTLSKSGASRGRKA